MTIATRTQQPLQHQHDQEEPATIVIAGAGIVGLALALALHKHVGITPELYEKASAFHPDVGAGMGVYPNGLRVLRDIDPALFQAVKKAGITQVYRQWERHDGSVVMTSEEAVLSRGDDQLETIGIRRWRLQQVLFEAVQTRGIPVYFGKETVGVQTRPDKTVEIKFADGSNRVTQILFGADGSKSTVREAVAGSSYKLEYTGVTSLMGIAADCPKDRRGISFPRSNTSQCHAAFFPTGPSEQCFQFHFPIRGELTDQGSWGNLSKEISRNQCKILSKQLRKDGWHERYLQPLENVTKAVKIGFCLLQPRLEKWVYGNSRIVLLGDAAHPPLPYTGQGAQQGLEDAGSLALLLQHYCLDDRGRFDLRNFGEATKVYERLRIPRTSEILDIAQAAGSLQQRRADSTKFGVIHEEMIQRQVFFHETLPCMFTGALYNYRTDVLKQLEKQPRVLATLAEEGDEAEQGNLVKISEGIQLFL